MPNQMRDVNAYVLANPDALQALFTEIFGKYLMRYYDASGNYAVQFDEHIETSFMNSNEKRIVIASKNITQLLKANVNVLAIAYHELAHVLYTNDRVRDSMRKNAVKELDSRGRFSGNVRISQIQHAHQQVHGIWNILEDQRIERLMISQFPFLKDILDPLRSILPEDNGIMSWRRQQYSTQTSNIPQNIITLAESFSNLKKFKSPTGPVGAKILADLYDILFPQQENTPNALDYDNIQVDVSGDDQAQQQGEPTPEDAHGDEPTDTNDGDEDSDELDAELDDEDDDDSDDFADDDGDELDDDADDEDDADGTGLGGDDSGDADEPQEPTLSKEELEKRDRQLARAQAQDESEQGILRMLKDIQKTMRQNAELLSYKESVIEDHKPAIHSHQKDKMISKILSIAQDVRNGMTAAQRKSYNSNISHRISVPRVVEALASKQEPKVFSNKGKDFTNLKKVVIFEDVSGSTAGNVSKIFSTTAYALAKSFTTSEWWLYGSRLAQKKLADYDYYSYEVGNRSNDAYGVGTSTNAEYLLNVMKKYRNEKAVYVIITDGDMHGFINDQTFELFKDSIAVIGFLDDEIKKKCPRHFDLGQDLLKLEDTLYKQASDYTRSLPNFNDLDYSEACDIRDAHFQKLLKDADAMTFKRINQGLQQVVGIVKGLK